MTSNVINDDVIYAVAYCRYSSNNQREESIDAQLRAIREYAKNNNIIILKEYCDSATTGTSSDRKEFLQMISDARKRGFTQVLVHKMDRFARNKNDSFGYKFELSKYNVRVVSVLERIDDTPEGALLEGLLDSLADFYSKNLARETMKGMKENAFHSKSNGSRPPFGYKLVPRRDECGNILYSKKRGEPLHDLAIDEEKAEAVKKIFDMTLERRPYYEICQYLKDNNFKTAEGNDFKTNNLLNILRNERYTGTYIFNQYKKVMGPNGKKIKAPNKPEDVIRNEDAIPAIISKEKFRDVQKLLNSRIKKSPGNKIEDYLLTGKIVCGECLSTFCGERKRKHTKKDGTFYRVYYRCRAGYISNGQKHKSDCHNSCIRKEEIEEFVLKQIADLIFSQKNFDAMFNYYKEYKDALCSNEHAINDIEKKIDKVNLRIKNLYGSIADMGYNEELKSMIQSQEQMRENLKESLELAKSFQPPEIDKEKIKKAYDKLSIRYKELSLENKKTLVDIFLNKVVVYKDNVEVFLNVLPSIMCEDYGLDIDSDMINKKIEGDANSPSISNKNVHTHEVCTKCVGSPGRIRTYDLSVNSRALHH